MLPGIRFGFHLATCLLLLSSLSGQQTTQTLKPEDPLLVRAFSTGWMLKDTNGDGLADAIEGKIVVPNNPTAAENAAAANLAARVAFGTTALTLPLVVPESAAQDARIWIGRAVPQNLSAELAGLTKHLEANEGGIFVSANSLAVLGHDDPGLTAAADAFSARAPFVWKVPGDSIASVVAELNRDHPGAVTLAGVSYLTGKAGLNRVFLHGNGTLTEADLRKLLAQSRFASVHELILAGGAQEIVVTNPRPLPSAPGRNQVAVSVPLTRPPTTSRSSTPAPTAPRGSVEPETPAAITQSAAATESEEAPSAAASSGSDADATATPQPLDLASLYTSRGLFKGTPKMPIPSSSDGQLFVDAGPTGIEMANLAARLGLETTGLSLPIAKAAPGTKLKDVKSKAVVQEHSDLGQEVVKKLHTEDTAHNEADRALAPGEGELRVVDRAFNKQSAILVRGDERGSRTALDYLNNHLPNLWETGKQHASIDEVRYDLHRFFSLRSSAGQAAVSLYHLDQWAKDLRAASPGAARDVKAEVYVDVADPSLRAFVQKQLQAALPGSTPEVHVGSLHAGTQCCASDPAVHYEQPGFVFEQAKPTFEEDITIPWEGARLLKLVETALHDIRRNSNVALEARVSEGPEVREKLKARLTEMIQKRGIPEARVHVQVLCAFKQGYSWLLDEVAPQLAGKPVSQLKIEFAKDVDPTGVRVMYSPARWVQELYPVDELVAAKLKIPLKNVELSQFEPAKDSPTYRVHAFDNAGKEIFTSEFAVSTVMRAYNGVIPRYEQVQIETGWVKLQSGATSILNQRIKTDLEEFWDHYQDETLPKVFHHVMAQAKGDLKPEFAPIFDTLRLDVHMSEPNYAIGVDKERISTLEALQEDTFYSTENFANMVGNLEAGKPVNYVGRILPVVHDSEDEKDGHVHIEFYAKPAANPVVRLSWTGTDGQHHEKERDLPVIAGAMNPRLLRARLKDGAQSIDDLMWTLPADYRDDDYDNWLKVEPREQVERSIFSVAQAKGQIHWLEEMHDAGLYSDDVAYPHLQHLSFEFELPVPLDQKAENPAPHFFASWNVKAPAHSRPMIDQFARAGEKTPLVQWDEPIGPQENAAVLAGLAKHPGVNVYWMGRSYLGRNIWAADFTLPTPSQLRSPAKETTLKATIFYSGRQHANEVSSTSHLLKLGEQLATDPATRATLKQVNVVLHPIDNPDGAELSVALAKITPDNLLHPGYHGSLAADVAMGQPEPDPVYPESRTRRQLLESWLPDGFLNPHGYPSHEWVQPFSEYTAWVQTREGANPGRAWWIPRGWFTSLNYIRDLDHPYSEKIIYEIRDKIVEAERNVPGLLDLETRMNDRYQRFGQRWQPKDMTQPIVNGVRIYMALKGQPAARPGAEGQRASATGGVSPDITWDSGYTEAPDETAHGDYMKLMASAGLAFDHVHLNYMANGKLRIRHVQREAGDKVTWQIIRDRPTLPASEETPARTQTN